MAGKRAAGSCGAGAARSRHSKKARACPTLVTLCAAPPSHPGRPTPPHLRIKQVLERAGACLQLLRHRRCRMLLAATARGGCDRSCGRHGSRKAVWPQQGAGRHEAGTAGGVEAGGAARAPPAVDGRAPRPLWCVQRTLAGHRLAGGAAEAAAGTAAVDAAGGDAVRKAVARSRASDHQHVRQALWGGLRTADPASRKRWRSKRARRITSCLKEREGPYPWSCSTEQKGLGLWEAVGHD